LSPRAGSSTEDCGERVACGRNPNGPPNPEFHPDENQRYGVSSEINPCRELCGSCRYLTWEKVSPRQAFWNTGKKKAPPEKEALSLFNHPARRQA